GGGRLETQVMLRAGRLSYFVVTGSSKELLEKQCIPLIEEFLRLRGLELSQEKTKISPHQKSGTFSLGRRLL
ncbi:hypothetical protein ACFL6S_29425, partial [Candidatus Poribacteria bacterium]